MGERMASLIEELQRDALNPNVRVADLLRKAKTIAVKLDLPELEKWVENELNGYRSADVPDYRILEGHVRGLNPHRGWIPVLFKSNAREQAFTKRHIRTMVAEMESLTANSGGGELTILLSAEEKRALRRRSGLNFDFAIFVPSSALIGILDAIRNALLDWSLKLEKLGVRGDGMSFSPDEREKAREAQVIYNIGSIGTLTGNIGSGSGSFTVEGNIINPDSKSLILDLVDRIRSSEAQLGLNAESAKNLNQALDGLQSEVTSREPSSGRVKEFLASIRSIAEGVAGNFFTQGILYELSKLTPH